MTRTLPFAILASAALVSGGVAVAQTAPARTNTHVVQHQTVTRKTTPTGKTTAAVATRKTATTTRTAATGRMVTAKTSTGKTVTYDCSKAGNATKAACKK
ncbi:MAG: hypothetical protein PGN23_12195 [Sphingomonas adhaesiva]|uniref:hypothetical protein n=1 Tax=Sphingomonas adhaesiva TaxID=28212 RepID=UPI002FFA473B